MSDRQIHGIAPPGCQKIAYDADNEARAPDSRGGWQTRSSVYLSDRSLSINSLSRYKE